MTRMTLLNALVDLHEWPGWPKWLTRLTWLIVQVDIGKWPIWPCIRQINIDRVFTWQPIVPFDSSTISERFCLIKLQSTLDISTTRYLVLCLNSIKTLDPSGVTTRYLELSISRTVFFGQLRVRDIESWLCLSSEIVWRHFLWSEQQALT